MCSLSGFKYDRMPFNLIPSDYKYYKTYIYMYAVCGMWNLKTESLNHCRIVPSHEFLKYVLQYQFGKVQHLVCYHCFCCSLCYVHIFGKVALPGKWTTENLICEKWFHVRLVCWKRNEENPSENETNDNWHNTHRQKDELIERTRNRLGVVKRDATANI